MGTHKRHFFLVVDYQIYIYIYIIKQYHNIYDLFYLVHSRSNIFIIYILVGAEWAKPS